MKIPKGMSETEVLEAIDRTANRLAAKFRFGYNTIDDMKQYARMFAIGGLDNYDPKKGSLDSFLWKHVRNRLFNLKRDTFERPDKPCFNCPLQAYDPNCAVTTNQCMEYKDKLDCEAYNRWFKRNAKKRNIIHPIGLMNVDDENEDNMSIEDNVEILDQKAIIALIDTHIPINIRALWVKLKNDVKLNKQDKEKVLDAIREILDQHMDTEDFYA